MLIGAFAIAPMTVSAAGETGLSAEQQANFASYVTDFINDGNAHSLFTYSAYWNTDKTLNMQYSTPAYNACTGYATPSAVKALFKLDPTATIASWGAAKTQFFANDTTLGYTNGYIYKQPQLVLDDVTFIALMYKNVFGVDFAYNQTTASGTVKLAPKVTDYVSGTWNGTKYLNEISHYATGSTATVYMGANGIIDQSTLEAGDIIVALRGTPASAVTMALYLGEGKVAVPGGGYVVDTTIRTNTGFYVPATAQNNSSNGGRQLGAQILSDGSVNPYLFRIQDLSSINGSTNTYAKMQDGSTADNAVVYNYGKGTDIYVMRLADRPASDGSAATVAFHNYASMYDENSHWQECAGCGGKKNVEAHVYDGALDAICNVCGYIRSLDSKGLSSAQQEQLVSYIEEYLEKANEHNILVYSSFYGTDAAFAAGNGATNFDGVSTYQTGFDGQRIKRIFCVDRANCSTWTAALNAMKGVAPYDKVNGRTTAGYLEAGYKVLLDDISFVALMYYKALGVDLRYTQTYSTQNFNLAPTQLDYYRGTWNNATMLDMVLHKESIVNGAKAYGSGTLINPASLDTSLMQAGDIIVGARFGDAAKEDAGTFATYGIYIYLGDGKVAVPGGGTTMTYRGTVANAYGNVWAQVYSDGSVNPDIFRIQNLSELVGPTQTVTGDATTFTQFGFTDIKVMRLANRPTDTDPEEIDFHIAASEWTYDATGHWHACACGEKLDMAAHVFSSSRDTTCDTCGYTRTIGTNSALSTEQQAIFASYVTDFINDGNAHGALVYSVYNTGAIFGNDGVLAKANMGEHTYKDLTATINRKAIYMIDPRACETFKDANVSMMGKDPEEQGANVESTVATGGYMIINGDAYLFDEPTFIALMYYNCFGVDMRYQRDGDLLAPTANELWSGSWDGTQWFNEIKTYNAGTYDFYQLPSMASMIVEGDLEPGDILYGARFTNEEAKAAVDPYSYCIAVYLGDGNVALIGGGTITANVDGVRYPNTLWPEIYVDGSVNPNLIRIQKISSLAPVSAAGSYAGANSYYMFTDVKVLRLKSRPSASAEVESYDFHEFNTTEWAYDADGHYHACVCGDKIDEAAHVFGDDTICDICGYDSHVHSYVGEWHYDAENHWKECACGDRGEATAHTGGIATCNVKAICDICGQPYGDFAAHEDPQHVEAKAATYAAAGNIEYYYCATCEKYFSDAACTNEITAESTVIAKLIPGPNTATITPASVNAKAGEEFDVTITLANNPGIGYLSVSPVYGEGLTFVSLTNGTVFTNAPITGRQYIWNDDVDATANGTLATVRLIAEEAGTYNVSFIVRDAYNYSEEEFDIAIIDGTVTVTAKEEEPEEPDEFAITTQPTDVNVVAGNTASFTVVASGEGLTYKWQYRKTVDGAWANTPTNFSGRTEATLSFATLTTMNGWQFKCQVKNADGESLYTDVVTLTAEDAIAITTQPSDVNVVAGNNAEVTVVAEGNGLTYSWQYRKSATGSWANTPTDFSGRTAATLSGKSATKMNGWQFRCVITDAAGNKKYSDVITFTIDPSIIITTQPQGIDVMAGTPSSFTVVSEGPGLTYKWQYRKSATGSWANTPNTFGGRTAATLTVTPKSSMNGWQVRCLIKDASGNTIYTEPATFTIANAIMITSQPVSTIKADPGETIALSMSAESSVGSALTYKWQYRKVSGGDWANAPQWDGRTTDTLMIPTALVRNGWQFRCYVRDEMGNATYTIATTLVCTPAIVIASQPADVTTASGTNAVFSVDASVSTGEELTYTWQYRRTSDDSWANALSQFEGRKTDTLTVPATASRNGWQFRCLIKDSVGKSKYTDIATLTVA